jgi:heptosyltransferase-1
VRRRDKSMHNPAAPRVLIVRVGAMGDVLHGMPAVSALRALLPDAFIGWAVEPRWASLLQAADGAEPRTPAMPLVDCIHEVPTKQWSKQPLSLATLRSVLALRKELQTQRYDIAIDLQGSIRSAIIARMSGARCVIGSTAPREAPARLFYTQRIPLHTPHVVQQATEIVSAAMNASLKPGKTPLPIDADAEEWCDAFVARTEAAQRIVLLAPTAGWGAKQWPAERYGELANELTQRGFRVLVNAPPFGADAVVDAAISAAAGAASVAPCTVPQLTALLRRAALVVAGDTGPLHMAAALCIPTVAIFGPTDPVRNGPWAAPTCVLRSVESVTDHHRHATAEAGLAQIEVAQVLDAAMRQLDPLPRSNNA